MAELCEKLATRDSFPFPFTFGRAKVLVGGSGHSVKDVLVAGMATLSLKYFPDVKFRDFRKNKKLYWNAVDFIQLLQPNEQMNIHSVAGIMTQEVIRELHLQNYCHARYTERYEEHGMPWMVGVLARLPPNMTERSRLLVATFATCVGMLMNGDFVSFQKIKDLVNVLPITQKKMQDWKILGKFMLQKRAGVLLFTLHETIPSKFSTKVTVAVRGLKKAVTEEEDHSVEEEMDDSQVLDLIEPPEVPQTYAVCLPATAGRKWSPLETALIDTDPALTSQQAYQSYIRQCASRGMHIRTWSSFQAKRSRFMKRS